MKISKKKKIFFAVLILLFPLVLAVLTSYYIEHQAENRTFFDVNKIPKNKVGLLLGTARLLSNGNISPYFQYRVNAAVELFRSGKIEFILISGDNGRKGYDEPNDFKAALLAQGIPENKIYLDYAGFRTLDSVVRAHKIFGQDSLTIISQKFHNERAIYLASKNNISAVGFNARDLPFQVGLKVNLREYLARTKVFVDLILGVTPKYLGKKIEIK